MDAESVRECLGGKYEIVSATPDQAIDYIEDRQCEAVFAAVSDFAPIEGGLIARQSMLLLDAIGEGVCLADAHGHVVWSNSRFRTYHSSVKRRVSAVCRHAISRLSAMRRSAAGQTVRTSRYSVTVRETGRHLEVLISPVEGEVAGAPSGDGSNNKDTGELTMVGAVVRDVTSRKRMQQKIDAIDQSGRQLMHFDVETVRQMHTSERLRLLEERVTKAAHDLLQFDHFAVRLLNEETNELELVMSTGLPREATNITLFADEEDNGISGYVAATGKSYICPDAARDERYVYGLDRPGSSLTVPLLLFDRVRGVFNIESEEVGAFNETDRQFAEIFARYLSIALHILDLLVVERYTTSQSATGVVEGEISEPLNDLLREAEILRGEVPQGSETERHIDRIFEDVESIRRRLSNVAQGPRTLLGIEEAVEKKERDPVLVGKRILVVDNESSIRTTIRDVLTARGARVVTCENGSSAVRLLEQWGASFDAEESFDLVISDINLGDRTGYDVFAAAKQADPDVPVMLMTGFGYDPHHSIVRASQEGLQCVLFKPFQAESMVKEAKKAISGAEVEEQGEGS